MFFFFQAEDGIRDLVRSRGLGDVYKRQTLRCIVATTWSKCRMRRFSTPLVLGPGWCRSIRILSLIHI